MRFKVRNWEEYQHYKDRNPPWIKLHFALLTSEDWVLLDDASRVLAIACLLIASRNDGYVPCKPDYIKRVAYLNQEPDFNPLIECGFLDPDSGCKQALAGARPEERQSREETEAEEDAKSKIPPCPYDEIVESYHRNQPTLAKVMKLTPARKKAVQARWREDQAHREEGFWDAFFGQCVSEQPFLLGQNPRGWKADFEWLMKQANFWKVVEGKYKEAA